MEDENVQSKTATLTHKVRNPQALDQWLDIWKADVSANFDYTNPNNVTRNAGTEKVIITPSANWQIPAQNLKGINLSQITVPPDEDRIDPDTKQVIGHNYFIHLLKTNGTGGVVNGPTLSNNGSINKLLNEKGQWTFLKYSLEENSDNQNQKYYSLKLNYSVGNSADNDFQKKSDIVNIQYQNPIQTSYTEELTENGIVTAPASLTLSIAGIVNDNISTEASISTSKLDPDARTAINNNKTVAVNGTTTYSETNASKIWATDENGKPSWQYSTAQFNTKLLGTIISEKEPRLESDTSTFTRSYSKKFTGSFRNSENVRIAGTGWAYYEQIYNRTNKTLKIFLTNLRFRSNNSSDYYIWSAFSNGNVINKIYNISDETEGIISLSSFLDYYIDEYLEDYLNEENSFDNFKALTGESDKFGWYKFGDELLTKYEGYYNGDETPLPENVNIVSWEDEFNTSYIVSEWDYNHCGIWIET